MHSFLVLILGFLFVSFHPSRFRSHSCSTGASLCPLPCVRFFVGIFCLPSAFFRPLQPASDYSAFCTFFSLLPDFPHAAVLISAYLPHPYSLFPCFPSDSGTQLPAIPFSVSLLRVTGTTQLLASCFQLGHPLCFRFRFRLLGLSVLNFSVRFRPRIYYHLRTKMSTSILYIIQLLSCTMSLS